MLSLCKPPEGVGVDIVPAPPWLGLGDGADVVFSTR